MGTSDGLTTRYRFVWGISTEKRPTAAAANSVVAKDFNKFQPALKEVVAMLITLALSETG
jgi:hypothetical protein